MSTAKRRTAPSVINHLLAFEAAARLGSFRAAGEALSVTQGAVAQQVRTLEEKLGMALFERLPRGLCTTPQGREFLQRVQQALHIIEDATTELLAQGASGDPHQVVLSTTPAFASRWLIPRLGRLAAAHPQIALMIDASDSTRPLTGKGAVDMAVRWGTAPFAGCHARHLLVGQALPVCAPSLRNAGDWQVPADLASAPLVSDSHNNWKRWFDHYGQPGTRFTGPAFSQTILAIEAAEQGMGIALVPALLVANALQAGTLVLALAGHELPTGAGFYILTGEAAAVGSAAALVTQWLEQEAAEPGQLQQVVSREPRS